MPTTETQIPFSGTHAIKWPLLVLKDKLWHTKILRDYLSKN